MDLYQIKNLTYSYPDTAQPALRVEQLAVREGEFILVAGGSGSGKSSLVRVLAGLLPGFYGGEFSGHVCYRGRRLDPYQTGELAGIAGMVFQDPEKQMVLNSVEAEIAFGLENLGLPQAEMRRRAAEVMSFMGLAGIRSEFTANLSGGQKQKLAIASVLAMQPEILILDEPTSQLDPVAAEEILNLCKRINEEMGITVILVEQRLERCFHLADRILYLENGAVAFDGNATDYAKWAVDQQLPFLPPVSRLFAELGTEAIPVTVKGARQLLQPVLRVFAEREGKGAVLRAGGREGCEGGGTSGAAANILDFKNVWYTYPTGREALKGISLRLEAGQFLTLLGENGAGKSTLLKIMAGLLQPGRGQAVLFGEAGATRRVGDPRIGYLSQNPNDYLFHDTVFDEIASTLHNFQLPDAGRVEALLAQLGLQQQKSTHPRDLSGGERQRVALASVLVTRPQLLILDEPTRGLDYRLKQQLGGILRDLVGDGCSLVMVTHDVEFAAQFATRAAVMFDGQIVSEGTTREVLGTGLFYSTQMAKMFRGYGEPVLTTEEAREKLRPLLTESRGDIGC